MGKKTSGETKMNKISLLFTFPLSINYFDITITDKCTKNWVYMILQHIARTHGSSENLNINNNVCITSVVLLVFLMKKFF